MSYTISYYSFLTDYFTYIMNLCLVLIKYQERIFQLI